MANQVNPTELQSSLTGVDYPASKAELMRAAKLNNSDKEVISFLEQIPERDYNSPTEVSQEIER